MICEVVGSKKAFFHNSYLIILKLLIGLLLFGTSATVFAGNDGYVDIPLPSEFIPATNLDGSPKYISDITIEREIRKYSPNLKEFYHNQLITQFIVPKHEWFDHLLITYDDFLYTVKARSKENTWDCENYSSMLNALTTIKVWQAGYIQTRAAIGWLRVNAKKEWAGLPGTMHAVMFAVTSDGIFIVEPQNGQYIDLSKYPNRQYIEEVNLF